MKNTIEKYFTIAIIIVLVIIILLEKSCNSKFTPEQVKVETKIDTIWKTKTDTIVKNVKVSQIIHVPVPADPKFYPSDDIDTCKVRFNKLLTEYLTKRVYKDTLKLDSLGTIVINDTVFMNALGKRTKIYDYKIPFVTKTVTVTKQADPRRQLYIGGNIFGSSNHIELVTPGLLYKSKHDNIYQINLGVGFDGSINYGIGTYWKIKLK